MNNSLNKNNKIIRAALFLEYDGKCFYEGLPIRFQDMHIDHIIPTDTEKNGDLDDLLKKLALPTDFNLNSLYNLVPCSPHVNQVKNKKQYPPEYLAHCIYQKTASKVLEIKNRIEKLKKEHALDKDLARLTARLNNFSNKKELEELYNSLSNEKPFQIKRDVTKSPFGFTYEQSLPNVSLVGHIPMYPKLNGNCLITFSNLRLRDCMITIDHRTIMESLFQGVNTGLELNLRNFIIHSPEINKDIYYVDLSNTRIPLEKEEIKQLITIIDDFAAVYIAECRNLYLMLNRDIFEKSGDKYVKLFKIHKKLWLKMIEFCREFDYEEGESDWHTFDSHSSFIKIFDKHKSEFRAFIVPKIEESTFLIHNSEDIWLTWTDEFFWENRIEDIETNRIWSPLYTYHWLTKEFIPYVIYYSSKKEKRNFLNRKNKFVNFEEFRKTFNIENYTSYLPNITNDNCSTTNLLSTINELRLFYSTYCNAFYECKDLKNLYQSLIILLQKSDIDKSGIEYIKSKLNISNGNDKDTIIHEIKNIKNNITSGKVYSGFKIDLIFRTLEITLRDYNIYLLESEINSIRILLAFFIETKQKEEVRRKF